MITPVLLSVLGSVVGTAVAQTFEPVDFNVTEGLLDLGVDVTQLPELSDLVERSANSHCAAAVSLSTTFHQIFSASAPVTILIFCTRNSVCHSPPSTEMTQSIRRMRRPTASSQAPTGP